MSTASITIAGLLAMSSPAASMPMTPIWGYAFHQKQQQVGDWKPSKNDTFVVDTKTNEGYLIHSDGRYIRFPVATGQKRVVRYIGRTYYAATPNQYWEAKSKDIKWDRTTFGPSGRFIRLYKDGKLRTAYGIHEYRYEDEFFAEQADDRYKSMGCVIVKTPIMDIVDKTFELDANLPVHTVHGADKLLDTLIN